MIIISPTELRGNLKKYLDLAAITQGIEDIKQGKYKALDPNKGLWENIL